MLIPIKKLCCTVSHCNGNSVNISFSGNSAASAPIFTFMCLWAIYIFPGSVHIFPPAEKADPSWEYIIRSQAHCKNLSLEFTTMNTDRFLWWRIYVGDRSWVFTVALRPGESKDGQLSKAWAPPFCAEVSFRNVLGREYTQSPRSTPYGQ